MENNRYYTPDASEFHVGFEYEIFEDWDVLENKSWHKRVWERYNLNPENLGYPLPPRQGKIRVKYLSKEDIEDLGFIYMVDSYSGYFTNGKVRIAWFYDKSGIEITKETNAEFGNKTLFSGTIKNKMELKKILEQLNTQ